MVTLKNRRKEYIAVAELLPPDATVDAVLIQDCREVELDFSHVSFSSNVGSSGIIKKPLIELRDTHDSLVTNVTHIEDFTDWLPLEWRNARVGVVVRGNNNGVMACHFGGVYTGVALIEANNYIKDCTVKGFSGDAFRILASECELMQCRITDAYWGNELEHADAIQLFPLLPPEQQQTGELANITIRDVRITNQQNTPAKRWMQGISLTDGVLRDSCIEDVVISTDHPHGVLLAQAHNVTLRRITVEPQTVCASGLTIGTQKTGYAKSRNVVMQACAFPQVHYV